MKGERMTTMNELSGGEPADRAVLDAIIREVGDPHPATDGWATIREWGAANLSPAVLADTQAAVRDELRTLFGITNEPADPPPGGLEPPDEERRRVAGHGSGHSRRGMIPAAFPGDRPV